MAIGRTNTGGGAGLNFKVVGGTSQPTSATENTIWVDTDVDVSCWIISASEPSSPSDGMVWIRTGTSSTVAFNALKKNGIQVYPTFCSQYVNGQFVDKAAQTYMNGEWVDWITYLFNNGNQCEDITGGWVGDFTYFTYPIDSPTISNTIKLAASTVAKVNHCSCAGTANMIDLTDVSTIYVEVSELSGHGRIYASTTKNLYDGEVVQHVTAVGTVALDVSALNGKHYIAVAVASTTATPSISMTATRIWRGK